MSKKVAKKKQNKVDDQTLWQVFWSGFFLPAKLLWRTLTWLSHQFPLKHVGHLLRWISQLPPFRLLWRVLGLTYIRASWKELRGVTWPTFRDSRRLTFRGNPFSIVFGLIIAVVDYGLDKVFKELFVK
ncbi:preprotein translocase subunit SecE [Candidatus Saccharibacteria bacterium]|nr:MAG: preprotein translocase subunit SecE [Candidatus Saccharibacteria bacterium]